MKIVSTNISSLFKSPVNIIERDEAFFSSSFHAHPEFELVYIKEGFGKKIIGTKVTDFAAGELLLIGQDVPHIWMSDKSFYAENCIKRSKALVAYFNAKIFSDCFYEMEEAAAVNKLFLHAKYGIEIAGKTKEQIVVKLEKMLAAQGLNRCIILLDILNTIAVSNEYNCINEQVAVKQHPASDRLTNVFNYINANFKKNISLKEVARIINLTPESFCRFFKQKTGKNFIDYLQQTRLSHASKFLLNTDLTVAEIAYKTGFTTASNFNKLFKKHTGCCPTAYRKTIIVQ